MEKFTAYIVLYSQNKYIFALLQAVEYIFYYALKTLVLVNFFHLYLHKNKKILGISKISLNLVITNIKIPLCQTPCKSLLCSKFSVFNSVRIV